ncbi:hypothetical protein [Sphingomonas sp.]|uniref:hypothetical protein n=1 Tax=Sphingomonas sp. TaxID=28214 RepID=UPI00182AA8EB|nr:hypothetical protein [Sphingomonas sp.]MBA3510970.1 hypothetical protein [Sphingomonas sp.]
MRGAAALACLLAAGACTQGQDQRREQRQSASAKAASAEQPTLPVLLRYLPPERGGPEAYPEAIVSGVLDLSGPCVRLQDGHGRVTTVVSAPGAYLRQDAAGLYIQSGRERLRHGSSVTGGGGWFDNLPAGPGTLDRPIPAQCRSGPYVVVTDIQRYDPSDDPPPRSPPPPGP